LTTALEGPCSSAPDAAEIGEPAVEEKSISAECKMASAVELRDETHALPGLLRCARTDRVTIICKRDNSSYVVVRRVKV
jgi:hypothetical protein